MLMTRLAGWIVLWPTWVLYLLPWGITHWAVSRGIEHRGRGEDLRNEIADWLAPTPIWLWRIYPHRLKEWILWHATMCEECGYIQCPPMCPTRDGEDSLDDALRTEEDL